MIVRGCLAVLQKIGKPTPAYAFERVFTPIHGRTICGEIDRQNVGSQILAGRIGGCIQTYPKSQTNLNLISFYGPQPNCEKALVTSGQVSSQLAALNRHNHRIDCN
jgi:hypothetical protein